MGNGLKLLLMIFLGFLLIEVGLTGALGSMIGALIVPDYMTTTPAPAGPGWTQGPTETGIGWNPAWNTTGGA